jgi:hypothetical protein
MNPTSGVLSEAWGLYKAHWRHLLSISFVVYLAVAVIGALLTAVLTWLGAIVGGLLSVIAVFWVQGFLVKAVEDVRDGRADLSLAETFQRVRPRLGAIAIAGILATIAIAIGLILVIVPGLILLTWWVLIVPVIVLEGRSAGESFARSRELVRGYGWNVFGVIVLTLLLLLGFSIVLGLILSPLNNSLQSFISNLVSNTLTTPFIACTWTLLYFRLLQAHGEQAAQAVPGSPAADPGT